MLHAVGAPRLSSEARGKAVDWRRAGHVMMGLFHGTRLLRTSPQQRRQIVSDTHTESREGGEAGREGVLFASKASRRRRDAGSGAVAIVSFVRQAQQQAVVRL